MRTPNLLFVFPDQMRGSALGLLGREPVLTPCLDAFAREAVCPGGFHEPAAHAL